jgi:hypothetical protein
MIQTYTANVHKVDAFHDGKAQFKCYTSKVEYKAEEVVLSVFIKYKSFYETNPHIVALWEEKKSRFYLVGGYTRPLKSDPRVKAIYAWIEIHLPILTSPQTVYIHRAPLYFDSPQDGIEIMKNDQFVTTIRSSSQVKEREGLIEEYVDNPEFHLRSIIRDVINDPALKNSDDFKIKMDDWITSIASEDARKCIKKFDLSRAEAFRDNFHFAIDAYKNLIYLGGNKINILKIQALFDLLIDNKKENLYEELFLQDEDQLLQENTIQFSLKDYLYSFLRWLG